MDRKAIISILFVMIFGISAFGDSYTIRKRVNPSQSTQTTTKHAVNKSAPKATKPTQRAPNRASAKSPTKSAKLRPNPSTTQNNLGTAQNNFSTAQNPTKPTSSTNIRASRLNASRNLSSAIKSSTLAKGASTASSGLSNTAITLSTIGGTALAGGVGGGIYALVKPKKEATSTPNNEPIVYADLIPVNIGVVDSGYNPNQIAVPSKNFYNIGYTPPANDPGHGTNVAKSIRAYNTESPMYMYSARCPGAANRGICPQNAMKALLKQDVRIINGSWGATTDKGSTTISVDTLNAYFSDDFYYSMAKEAATRRIFVFAAGNDAQRHANIQSSIPLVGIKATKQHNKFDKKIWENSKRGWIAVTATYWGNNLLDTRYANWIGEEAQNWGIATKPHSCTGTSCSAPVVSAVAANVWNQFPWMSNHLVTQTILSTADKYTIGANSTNYSNVGDKWHANEVTDGPNKKTGWGILNQSRALKGPARFDKRLLVPDDKDQVQVNFAHQNYRDLKHLTFSNDIAGDAGLRKYGNGTLYMSGSNTYTGNTDIDDGTLVLSNALLSSKITINTNGTLRTQNLNFVDSTQPSSVTLGTLNTGYTLTNHGRFEVLKDTTLNGDYISGDNATLSLDVGAKLDIKGRADMSKGRLAVHSLSTIPSLNPQTKTLLTAQNGINQWSGAWSVAEDSSAFLSVSEVAREGDKDLSVTYKRNSASSVIARAFAYTPQSLQNIGQGLDNALNNLAESNAKTAESANTCHSKSFSCHSERSEESKKNNLVILSEAKYLKNRDSSPSAQNDKIGAENDNLRDFAESTTQIAESTESTLDSAISSNNATNANSAFYAEALQLLSVTQQDATNAVASLSGEIYDSNLSITHKSAMLLNRTIARRLYQINDGAQSGVWADISYARSKLASKDYATGKITQYAIMAGIDGIKAEKNSAFGGGALFSVDRAKGDFGVVGNSDMLSYALSLYGVVSYEKFYMLARIGAALHDTDVTRKLAFGNGTTLQNKQKDMSYHGYIEMGYNLVDGEWFRLTPFIAWEEDLITRKKVSESGKNGSSNFSLVLDSAKYRVYSLIYGAKGHFKFGGFAIEYSALDMFAPNPNKFLSKARFSGNEGNSFASSGIPQARNLVFVSLGASYAFSQLILRGEYSISLNPDVSKMIEDEIINLNLRYNF